MIVRVPPPVPVDVRVLGALAALGLDVLCLVVGVIFAAASQSCACFLLLGGAVGLVAAPVVGWRYGHAAAVGQPVARWAPHAMAITMAMGLALWFAWVIVAVAMLGVPGGTTNLVPFLAYMALESIVVALGVTLTIALPLGCVWRWLMRLVGRRLDLLAPER
jgi:hypothetical protein